MNLIKERVQSLFSSARMRGAAGIFASRSFNSLISLFFTLLAGKILAVEDYGLFTQSLARIVIAQALTEAGLQFSLVRFMAPELQAGNRKAVADIVRASLKLKFYAALATSCFFILAIFAVLAAPALGQAGISQAILPPSHPDTLVILLMIFLGGFGMSLLSYLESVLVAHEMFARLAVWLPSVGLIRLALLLLFAFWGGEAPRGEHAVFAFSLGPYLAASLFFLFFPAAFFFRSSSPDGSGPWIRRLFYFNLWILVASFLSIISDWMEIHMIPDSGDRGVYSAARMPLLGFSILLSTMQAVMLPRFSSLKNRDEYRVIFKKIYFFVFAAILLLSPAVFIFTWFIPWWFGPQYEGAVFVFWILYPSFLLRLVFAPLGTALYALDRPRLIALEAALRMGAGFLLNLFLIPAWGIKGAALAGFLSQFAGWFLLIYCFYLYFQKGVMPFQGKEERET